MIGHPMFEYAALVDAPVQRFTGIVTGAEPDDGIATVAVAMRTVHAASPVAEAPMMLAAIDTDPVDLAAVPVAAAPPSPVRRASATQRDSALHSRRPGAVPSPAPSAPPGFVPALVGAAIAGLTAMWWLRRDSHDRRR